MRSALTFAERYEFTSVVILDNSLELDAVSKFFRNFLIS